MIIGTDIGPLSVMYLCVCNALTEKCVRSALTGSNDRVSGVFGQHGTKPKCGKCLAHLREFMHRHKQDQSLVDTPEAS